MTGSSSGTSGGSSGGGSFDSLGWAYLGASVLSGMGGLGGGSKDGFSGGDTRDAYRVARNYQPELTRANAWAQIEGTIGGARDSGIHPLYALGAGGGGGSPAFAMPGQSPSGSHKDIGRAMLDAAQSTQMRKESDSRIKNDELQRQLTQLRIDEIKNDAGRSPAVVSNDPKSPYVLPIINTAVQEIKKGEVQTYKKAAPEHNLNVISPMATVRIGSQKVSVPVDEVDAFFEDPLAIGAATYLYHGNKNINWKLLWMEYSKGMAKAKPNKFSTKKLIQAVNLQNQPAKRRYRKRVKGRTMTYR